MIESSIALDWIVAQLKADATIRTLVDSLGDYRVYSNEVPQGRALPAVVVQPHSIPDNTGTRAGVVAMASPMFAVKVIGEGVDEVPLRQYIKRFRAQLNDQGGTSADGVVFGCLEIRGIPASTFAVAGGEKRIQIGGLYRCFAQEIPTP